MLFFARGDFHRMTPLRRIHRVRDVRALREARRLAAAQTAPRAARQTRRKRPQREREPRAGCEPAGGEPDALPPRRRLAHHDVGGLVGIPARIALMPFITFNTLAGVCVPVALRRPAQRAQRGFLRAPRGDPRGGLRMLRQLRLDLAAPRVRQFAVDKRRQRSQIEPFGQAGIVVVVIHYGFLTTFNGGTLRAGP